jgi:tetratricopeptide (TPR) repeat protein
MDTEVSSALSTLELDPQNKDARAAISRHAESADGDRAKLAAALAAARALHAERGNADLCLELIERELAITTDKRARADLLSEKARILFHEFARGEEAVELCREALEASQGHPAAGALLRKIQDEEAEWEKTAQTRLKQAKDIGGKAAAAPHYALAGELYLKYRPKSQEGESFLRRALETDPRQKRAEQLLERLYRAGGRLEELAALYDKRASVSATNDERAAAEVLAGEVALERGRQGEALDHFKKALSTSPAEPRALTRVVAALGGQDAHAELAKVYENALRVNKRGQNEMQLLLPLASVTWRKLDSMDQAELYFRRIRKYEPNHPALIEFYRDYHTRRNEAPQLLALLAQAQKAEADPDKRIRLGIEMAEIAEQRPQSNEKAIDIWKSLLRMRPGLPEAMTALRRLYTKTEKWNALLEMLKDDLEALAPDAVDEKIARYLEMIPVYRDRLKLDVMVTNTFAAILALRPDHPEALRALAERHEAQGRWADLIDVLQRQAAVTKEVPETVRLYHRIASLWAEKLAKQQNAIASLEKILELDARDEAARKRLKEIYNRGRSWRPLLELLRGELALLPADRTRAHLAEMADIAAERMGNVRDAIGLWNEVLAIDAADTNALTALGRLYEKDGRWPAVAEILGRRAAAAGEDSPAGCELLERRGLILQEKLGATQAAEEALRRVHAAQPDNPRVLRALREIHASSGNFAALEALYAQRGAWEELCEALSTVADKASESATQVKLLLRVAQIAESPLKQPDRAIKAYEKLFALRPRSRAIGWTLIRLYREAEKWGRLLSTYEAVLDEAETAPPDPVEIDPDQAKLTVAEQLGLLGESRKVCEERLGSKTVAFQWCARAYRLAPQDAGVIADLERLAHEADEWVAYADLLAARLTNGKPERVERIDLLRRSLRVSVLRLGRADDARRFAEEILGLVPEDEEAERALERILEERKEWGGLVKIWRRREERLAAAPAKRLELLFRIARAEEEELSDLPAAARTLRTILEQDATNRRALAALARVSEVTGDQATVAEILRRQVDEGLSDDPLPVLLRLASLEEKELKHPEAARMAYLQVLELDPVSPEAVAGLERLLDGKAVEDNKVPGVVARLVPYYELTENYKKWAAAIETLSERLPATERLPHLGTLVDLYSGPLDDTVAAFLTAQRIFELDPHDQGNRERLITTAAEVSGFEDLLATVRRVLAGAEESGFRRELLSYLAEIDEKRPGGGVEAEKVYREILSLDALHFGAYRALTRLYRDAERWTDLRALLETRQETLPEAKERLVLLWQVAEIDEALLEDREHVIGVLSKIAELDPTDLKAHRALEKHYAATGRWSELDLLLERERGMVSRDEATEITLRRAEIAHRQLQQAGRALDLIEEVVTSRPEHAGARTLLEEILPLPEHRQRAATILEPLYEASGDWQRLVNVLEAQLEAREAHDATVLLGRIAALQETALTDPAAALATWRRVLALEPSSMSALAEVERLAGSLGRQRELVALYEELAGKNTANNRTVALELLTRAARLQGTLLGDREAAIRTWRRIIELDPANMESARPAGEALELLYAQIGDFRGFVEVLRMRADWATGDAERAETLRRVAEIEEKSLGDREAAVVTYRSLLDENPEDSGPMVELERLYEALGQHRERVEIMRRRLEIATDAVSRRAVRVRMAGMLEQQLNDVDEAISMVLAILDESGDDVQALEMLSGLYEKKGAVSERLEVLDRQLRLATAPDVRSEILRRMAALLEGPLARPTDALDRWREVLTLLPADADARSHVEKLLTHDDAPLRLAAAQVLQPLYEADAAWAKVARLVELYIETDEDARDRMNHRIRLAQIQEGRLENRPAALQSYAAAIRDGLGDGQLGELLDAYERLADALGGEEPRNVVTLYRAIEDDVLNDDVRLRLARTVARRAETLGDGVLAAEYFRKVLDRAPDDVDVLSALERIYRGADNQPALLDVLLRRADLMGASPSVEAPLRLQIGALAVRLGRSDEAVTAYERVVALQPANPEAFTALEKLYSDGRHWTELCALYDRQLGRGMPPADTVAMHHRLAEIYLNELSDRHQALLHFGAALKIDREHEPTITKLEELLSDPEARVEAADLLESVYVRRNAWVKLVGIDQLRLERSEDTARRLALTQRIARVYEEQIEDLGAAFEWYGRLFRETPTERGAQEQVMRLAPKLERWKDVSAWFSAYLEGEPANTDEVLELTRLAASVADEKLGDRTAARKHYRRYVEAQPGDARACRLFETALERWEAWEELRDLLEEHATRLDSPSDRIPYLRRSAAISAERLNDRAKAVSSLRELLDIDNTDARAAADLEAFLRADERWSDLREHLLWTLDLVEQAGGDRNGVAFRLAEVEELKLAEVSSAIDRYGEILGRMPRHAGALAALERLLGDADHRGRVAGILEPHFRRTQEWRKLADVLDVSLESVDDSEKRSQVLVEMAGIEQQLGQLDRALEARGRAWLEDVTSQENLAALEPLASAGRLYPRMVQILRSGTERADDPALQASLWSTVAALLETRLGDAAGAVEAWGSAIQARPDDESAFVALERLLAQAGRSAELCEALEQHLEIVSDAERRKVLTKRMAVLSEDALRDRDKAVTAWRSVLEVDDADEEALDSLARLYGSGGEWRELADIYQRKIELAQDAATLRYLRFLSARVYDEKLGEADEGASQLRSVLDANPNDPDALAMLDRIFTREKQHIELLEVLDLRATAARAGDRDALAFRAAQLVEKDLDDATGAIARYHDLLGRTPGHEGARNALWELARGESYRLPAVVALEPVLRQAQEWPELVELLELRLQAEDATGVRLEILTEIARIREREQGDSKRAFGTWAEAFKEDPSDPGPREALERLAGGTGEYARLAEVYEARLEASLDPELEQTLAWRLAQIHEEKLGDPAKAIDFLRRVVTVPGHEAQALARLEVLLGRLARYPELEEILAREAEVATDPEAQAGFLANLGELRRTRLTDSEGAVRAFRDAVERMPTHPAALAALRALLREESLRRDVVDILEPLAESRGDFAELAKLYEVRVELEDSGPERAMWWKRVAELADGKLADQPRAIEALGKSLKDDPSAPDTAEALERIALGAGKPALAAARMEAVLGDLTGSSLVDLALRAAHLYEAAAKTGPAPENDGAAERLYRRALEDDAENTRALEALEALYRRKDDPGQLAKVLEQRGHVEMDMTRRRALIGEAARIHERMGDPKAAVAAWQIVREGDEGNAEALGELARLLEAQGDTEELVRVLEERARFGEDRDERASLFFRIGELRRGPLADAEGAAGAYREVLDIAPSDQRALAALAALELARGDFSALEEVLLRRLSVAQGGEKVDVLFALARNAEEKLEDSDRATSYLHQILEIDARSRPAYEALGRLLEVGERWYDLIELYERRANAEVKSATPDIQAEITCRLAIAELWGSKLGDQDSARDAIEKVLARDANHGGALLALAALHERAERWSEAAAALEKAAAVSSTPRDRAEVHFRRSRVLEARSAPDAEVEASLRAALEADPAHVEGLKAWEQRVRKKGDPEELARILESRAKMATSLTERKPLLVEIAGLYRGPLAAPAKAVTALSELAAASPADAQVQEDLAAALLAAGRPEDAEKLLMTLLEQVQKARQNKVVARVQRALGSIADAQGNAAQALQRYEAAYQLDPTQPAVVAALGKLSLKQNDAEKARRFFRALLLQSFDEKAAGITKAEVYLALGRLHLQANEPAKARNMFERGLETDSKNADLKAALATVPRA